MAFLGVLNTLNDLKKIGVIKDYAIGGGYAANYYLEPSYTYDLDILVLLDSEADYHALYKHFREKGNKIENVYIMIESVPVQFMPGFISPLFSDAIKQARKITVKGVPSKVVTAEYLIALLLVSFRPKDKIRILELVKLVDKNVLDDILRRFEDEKTPLRQRLGRVLENIQ
ncbi:MAG: hypothetical protein HYX79_01400 [Chloroflexi bacterium]|nr:hypothetical protein [Chloroflexota bacterium]